MKGAAPDPIGTWRTNRWWNGAKREPPAKKGHVAKVLVRTYVRVERAAWRTGWSRDRVLGGRKHRLHKCRNSAAPSKSQRANGFEETLGHREKTSTTFRETVRGMGVPAAHETQAKQAQAEDGEIRGEPRLKSDKTKRDYNTGTKPRDNERDSARRWRRRDAAKGKHQGKCTSFQGEKQHHARRRES